MMAVTPDADSRRELGIEPLFLTGTAECELRPSSMTCEPCSAPSVMSLAPDGRGSLGRSCEFERACLLRPRRSW